MQQVVPPVEPSLLIEANNAVSEQKGEGDATITMIAHFNGRVEPDMLVAINYRLLALAKIVRGTKESPWVTGAAGRKYRLVNEAMFRAAALTLLTVDGEKPVGDLAFDTEA